MAAYTSGERQTDAAPAARGPLSLSALSGPPRRPSADGRRARRERRARGGGGGGRRGVAHALARVDAVRRLRCKGWRGVLSRAGLGSSRLIDGAGWRDGALAGDGAAARGGPFARGEAPHCPRRARGAGRLRRPRAVEHAVRPLRRLLPLLPARPLRLRASGRQPRPLRLPRHGRAARRCPRGGGRPVRARGEGRGAPLPQRGVARPPLGAFSDPSRSAPPSRRRSSR